MLSSFPRVTQLGHSRAGVTPGTLTPAPLLFPPCLQNGLLGQPGNQRNTDNTASEGKSTLSSQQRPTEELQEQSLSVAWDQALPTRS